MPMNEAETCYELIDPLLREMRYRMGYSERVAADRIAGEQRRLNAWKTGISRE
jgi:hypothetical protein